MDDTIAVFDLNGANAEVALTTQNPYKIARGVIPDGIAPGNYNVSFRRPNGTVVPVGSFSVKSDVGHNKISFEDTL